MKTQQFNLARFDFVSIRLVVACERSGNLTEAARECHMVAPAASRRLRDLESVLGAPLFERHSRGLTPTALGRAFAKRGISILQEIEKLVTELEDARKGVIRHIRLCASTAAITQFLAPLLAQYADLRASVQVELEEQVSEQVVMALREGRADLAIFVAGPEVRGLELSDFRKDELVLILPPGHRLAGDSQISFEETLEEEWISLNSGAAMLQAQQKAAIASGKTFKLRMQVRSFDAVGHMVASGLGIAALPKGAALPIVKAMKLTWRPLSDAWASRQLLMAIQPDADLATMALRDFLQSNSQNAKSPRTKRQ